MNSSPPRVIFDRSAFDQGYQALKNSRLKDLCRDGRIRVFHTPTFLEETICAYGVARPRAADWPEHLQFALDTCNGGIFREKSEIWYEELVADYGTNASYVESERLMEILRNVARNPDISQEFEASEAERENDKQKHLNTKEILKEIRNDERESLGGRTWAQYRDEQLVPNGTLLMEKVCARRAKWLADRWAQRQARYPFFTAFVEGFSYMQYHAALRPHRKMDKNAQADYEQLAFLTWADIVVSEDKKFFRDAFDAIWKPRGKRLETAESFAVLANFLA